MARSGVNTRRVLWGVVAFGLVARGAVGEAVHVQDDFEDGDLTQNPSWVLEPPSAWSVQTDPTDSSNLVAQGIQSLGAGRYLRLNLPSSVPWEGVSLQADFLPTDASEYGLYLSLYIQYTGGGAAVRHGTRSGFWLATPKEGAETDGMSGDGWSLSAFVWYRFVLRYDQEKRQFITTISHRSSGQIIGQLSYTPPTAIETIPALDNIVVGVGLAAEGTVVYVDNILLRTMDPISRADFDEDGDVDLVDYSGFAEAFTGPS